MKRTGFDFLKGWYEKPSRKPLVIRGARQVGKTWLVRHFAESQNLQLLELNFEKNPELATHFSSNNPSQILLLVGASLNKTIDPKTALLFLDEIQAYPPLLAKLRWFAEEMPELAVIATGSLLEFTLEDHSFSMPVGRISYMHLEPLSFEEYLLAQGLNPLLEYLKGYEINQIFSQVIHDKLMMHLKEYILVGGMPAAVSAWVERRELAEVYEIHNDLLGTYRDDFTKYHGRLPTSRLDEVFASVPKQLGKRFVYSNVNPDEGTQSIKKAFYLLSLARVCHRIKSASANGVPLGAEVNDKFFKAIFIDVGLSSTMLGLQLHQITDTEEIVLINNGAIAEQVVGQLLRTAFPVYVEPELFYWQREKKGSDAEIDYVIQHHTRVIPIEVKAGTSGGLKSLHLFMGLRGYRLAVRINSDLPSVGRIAVVNSLGESVEYTLLSIPIYLLSRLHFLLESLLQSL